MRRLAITFCVAVCALFAACGTDSPRATGAATPSAPRRDALPQSWRLPDGWIWATETSRGHAVGLPGLPRSMSNPDRTVRMLIHETPTATHTIIVRAGADDAVSAFRTGAVTGGGTIVSDTAWRGTGRAFEVRSAAGVEQARILPRSGPGRDPDTLVLSVMSATRIDARAFFDSLALTDLTTPRRVHHEEGGFSIEAPSRVDPMNDRSAEPFVRGFHGLRDGAQIAATFIATPTPPSPRVALEAGMRSAIADMPGELVTSEPRDGPTGPELWYRCRARDGTFGSVRVTYLRGYLFTAATYAPIGEEPPWAERYLESLVVDPAP